MRLTPEEKGLLKSVENGEWRQIPDYVRESARYREAARATLRKDKRVNIRIAERDLVRLQRRAVDEGLPYQTLISSIIHKFVSGRLVEQKGIDLVAEVVTQLVNRKTPTTLPCFSCGLRLPLALKQSACDGSSRMESPGEKPRSNCLSW